MTVSVLVVDDDAALSGVLTRTLTQWGYEVRVASDGRAALEALAARPVDIVITDVNMPDMDGIELTLALMERASAPAVIAMSGGGLMPRDLLLGDAQALGAVAVLAKPFGLEELRRSLEAVLPGRSPSSEA